MPSSHANSSAPPGGLHSQRPSSCQTCPFVLVPAPPSKKVAALTLSAVTPLMLQGSATPPPWQCPPPVPLTSCLLVLNLVCSEMAAENKAQPSSSKSCLCFFQAAFLLKGTLASHTNFKSTKASFPAAQPLAGPFLGAVQQSGRHTSQPLASL